MAGGAIFLSASIPVFGRGNYRETADPFLIQFPVRELVMTVIRDRKIVCGGHPAITPMIWKICEDLRVDYTNAMVLYQSRFFADQFPEENAHFRNVVFVDAVAGDREASLQRMREKMLSRSDLEAAVFIGGMEGVEVEYTLFRAHRPDGKVLLVPATGGAARKLAERTGGFDEAALRDVDFARLFHVELPSPPMRPK
jgi:SLOG cluster3 family